MSDYHDIKKLCILSRLEIDDSEIKKTSEKIKEIITFFNKLDEFELNDKADEGNGGEQDIAVNNYMKLEKNIDDLRNDEPNLKLNLHKKIDTDNEEGDTSFNFNFLNKKNGYVIGPRI